MTVLCYEPERRSGFLQPGTKHHSLCSPGLSVPPETFELRLQISVPTVGRLLLAVHNDANTLGVPHDACQTDV